jgi:hypothetical protein
LTHGARRFAPSAELRKWFNHRVERWEEFRRRYRRELNANPGCWEPISRRGRVTLLYSARDTLHNGAVVLRDYLTKRESGRTQSQKRDARPRPRPVDALRSAGPRDRAFFLLVNLAGHGQSFSEHLVRESPFVVVPAHDLDQVSVDDSGEIEIDDGCARITNDV